MAESLCGDITPYQGISKEEKHKREQVLFNISFILLSIDYYAILFSSDCLHCDYDYLGIDEYNSKYSQQQYHEYPR